MKVEKRFAKTKVLVDGNHVVQEVTWRYVGEFPKRRIAHKNVVTSPPLIRRCFLLSHCSTDCERKIHILLEKPNWPSAERRMPSDLPSKAPKASVSTWVGGLVLGREPRTL